jgi:AcrR family transcriptional regulator
MGRKSKLTEAQWAEIEQRLIAGAARRVLAREYGVSETSIREHFGKQSDTVQAVAEAIVAAEVQTEKAMARLEALPPLAQISAQNLAAARKRIADNFAVGMEHGSDTFARTQQAANKIVRASVDNPAANVENLRVAAGLVKLGNDAMAGLAGKDVMQQDADEQGDSDDDARREALARRLEGPRPNPAG